MQPIVTLRLIFLLNLMIEIDRFLTKYQKRSGIFLKEMKKDPDTEIQIKLERNLLASNLVQEKLLSLYKVVSEATESAQQMALRCNSDLKKLANNERYKQIFLQLQNPSSISDSELVLIKRELLDFNRYAKTLESQNAQNEKYLESIMKCFSDSINSATKIYDYNDVSELKNVVLVSIKFIISSLLPFVSGIESIHQILNSRSIKFSNTTSYFEEMNEYYNSCFKHAVMSQYLEFLLRQSFSGQKIEAFDINTCIDLVRDKQLAMAKEINSEVYAELKQMFF
jgi:hypothetical protein